MAELCEDVNGTMKKLSICILLAIKLEASNKNKKPLSLSVFKIEAEEVWLFFLK